MLCCCVPSCTDAARADTHKYRHTHTSSATIFAIWFVHTLKRQRKEITYFCVPCTGQHGFWVFFCLNNNRRGRDKQFQWHDSLCAHEPNNQDRRVQLWWMVRVWSQYLQDWKNVTIVHICICSCLILSRGIRQESFIPFPCCFLKYDLAGTCFLVVKWLLQESPGIDLTLVDCYVTGLSWFFPNILKVQHHKATVFRRG